MMDAGTPQNPCHHETGGIILYATDAAGVNSLGQVTAKAKTTPSVNLHLSGAGTFLVAVYSSNSGQFDYMLHTYAP